MNSSGGTLTMQALKDNAAHDQQIRGGTNSKEGSEHSLSIHESNASLSGFKPDRSVNLESIHDLIHEPICSGFLFKYCEAFYCSENIRFVMEVDKYKDYFSNETIAWQKTWKELDRELDFKSHDNTFHENVRAKIKMVEERLDEGALITIEDWPSKKISPVDVERMIREIWTTFLSEKALTQICVPSIVLWNTMRRMRRADLYGREVFHEALQEPIRTIVRDIYPRFRNSEHMVMLRKRMHELESLPMSSELSLSPLPDTILSKYTPAELEMGVQFTLDDMLQDKTCFKEFFRYLQRCILSENLRFIRALQIYKAHISSPDVSMRRKGMEWAWAVYKFFIAPYSAFEISVSHQARREIMRQLADPNINTFDVIERTTMELLRVHYNNFRTKRDFANLGQVILRAHDLADKHSQSNDRMMIQSHRKMGCLGVF